MDVSIFLLPTTIHRHRIVLIMAVRRFSRHQMNINKEGCLMREIRMAKEITSSKSIKVTTTTAAMVSIIVINIAIAMSTVYVMHRRHSNFVLFYKNY